MNKDEELIRKKSPVNIKNKKAGFEYFFIETYTAGIVLTGTEIKSIRLGKASLVDTYCTIINGELWVKGMTRQEAAVDAPRDSETGVGNEADGLYHRAAIGIHRRKRPCEDGHCTL